MYVLDPCTYNYHIHQQVLEVEPTMLNSRRYGLLHSVLNHPPLESLENSMQDQFKMEPTVIVDIGSHPPSNLNPLTPNLPTLSSHPKYHILYLQISNYRVQCTVKSNLYSTTSNKGRNG
jgi:hypothetical protein